MSKIVAGKDTHYASFQYKSMAQSALGGGFPIGQEGLQRTIGPSVPQEKDMSFNCFKVLAVKEVRDYEIEIQGLVDRIKKQIWAEDPKWEYGVKRRLFRTWKHEGKAARASVDRDYWKLCMLE